MSHKQLAVRHPNALTGHALARSTIRQTGVLTKRTHFGIGQPASAEGLRL